MSDGTVDALLDEIEEFLTGIRHGAEPDRILATVLFTDIVDSTKQAAELVRFRGREVNTAGDYFLIAFDGPGRAGAGRRSRRNGRNRARPEPWQ